MNDGAFAKSRLFTPEEWRIIIQSSISAAHYLTKKIIMSESVKNRTKASLIPFAKKNEDDYFLQTLNEVITNLYKKCVRTNYLPIGQFVDKELDAMLNKFVFGVGARALEIMLKNFPFAFRFESRMAKFKEFVKSDKKNHDRSLFQQ